MGESKAEVADRMPQGDAARGAAASSPLSQPAFQRIAGVLDALGSDWRHGSQAAVLRCLLRRLQLLGHPTLDDYAERVISDAAEAQLLARDLAQPQRLMFRDGELYAGLLRQLPRAFAGAGGLQVWVPACSRGEDVYAVTMLLAQALSTREAAGEFLVYGSDTELAALQYARSGRFSAAAAERVPPVLRVDYLRRDGGDWSVQPSLREHAVFLHHAPLAPPPLFDVDLISCRSLFDDLEPAGQRQLLEQLHEALQPEGLLAAGDQPSLRAHTDLFQPLAAMPGLLLRVERSAANPRHDGPSAAVPADCHRQMSAVAQQPGPAVAADADQRLRERLDHAQKLAQLTLSALAEGVVLLDARGSVRELNPMAERLTGWSRDEALQQPYARVFRLQNANGSLLQDHPIDRALAGEPPAGERNDLYLRHRDGRRFALRLRLRSITEPETSLVLVFDDVSEMNLLTEELVYRATHDPLTGLLNRAEFETRARAVVAEAQRSGITAVLCYIDVDQFKVINDTLGHVAGDELLHELAGELRPRVAEHDTIARLGGDEFGVLLVGQDLQTARGIADSLIDTARRFRFVWQGQTYAVTISIGAALIDRDAEGVTRAMSMADAACFVAKDAGRDRALFAGNDDELASRHVQMSMIGKLGKSLDEDRFVLHYEDVVSIAAPQQTVYRELLVRMREADGRLLLPASFVQAAERYFLMGALDRWVLRHAFRGIAQLPEDGVIYAVNLSGQSLGDQKFLDFVLAELDRSGVDPQRICFEITETAAVSRLTEAVRFIARVSQCGCRFALDDFGSGMASFNYLKNFTVHFLKIDGSFVRAMLASRSDRGMVESINRIGHEMGLKTIAEHVETPAMLEPLRDMGVDWAQGRAIAWGKPFDALLQ